MTAASNHTATAVPPTEPSASSGLRLRLDSKVAGTGVVDGGWWPHSWDPEIELPELIAGLEASPGPITRVALNPDAWDRAPRRVAVNSGRRIRVGLVPDHGRPHDRGNQSVPGSPSAAGDTTSSNHSSGADCDGDGGRPG
jgi:Family of unknown function (DUF5994)